MTQTLHRGILLVCIAFIGCSGVDQPMSCTRELRVRLAPTDTVISIGEAFIPAIGLSSCGGREQLADTFTWFTADSLVIQVDPATGRITARSTGDAYIEVVGATYHRLGTISVKVR